jgi:diguanylate cyclase (GGDEF)-like protein
VSELETHSQEIGLLNELSNLLQSCLTAQEAYGILQQLGKQLFPGQAGLLGMTNASRNLVETAVVWGHADGQRLGAWAFSPEDCWALRRGRMHWYEARAGAVRCGHLGQAAPETYLCLPMMAHGETLGVLHLQAAAPGVPPLSAARRTFAQTVADGVSLALANLKLRERLRDQSIRDALTGLFNRRYLEETLDRELRRAERDLQPVGVLMLDIDHFKRFNDSFGHGAGDEVLRALGHLLMSHVRVEDIACRYGGEEFTVVLPGCSLETAVTRAEVLREQARDLQVYHAGQALGGITVSVGVAAFPLHGSTEAAVVRAADEALYQAKQAGRNRTSIASAAAEP